MKLCENTRVNIALDHYCTSPLSVIPRLIFLWGKGETKKKLVACLLPPQGEERELEEYSGEKLALSFFPFGR